MVSCFISRLVILVFGTLYPAYASYKAVRTKNVKEYVKWMMYWIVFALFTCAETFTDLFLSFWFPFYYEIKIITVIYLLSPATKGSSILYRKFVHPVLSMREQEIDEYIAKAKEQGYHTMLNLGSKGVTYATSLIMQTAIKGGGGLVNQLKKSYSLSDLSEEQHMRSIKRGSEDDVDSRYEEEIRRMHMQQQRRTISGTSPSGLYYPEVDDFQHPNQEQFYRQMPSSEDISSGYSSGDPLYYGVQRQRGDHLVRTASLGGTNRIRTRAATRGGLPKRSSLSEAGSSTWSTMESRESQIETDFYFNTPLHHSTSLPFSIAAFNPSFRPEFQYMLGNMAQPMFSFIDPSKFAGVSRDFQEEPKTQIDEGSTVVISEVKSQDDEITKPAAKDDAKDCGSTDKTDSSKELAEVKSEVKDKTETAAVDDSASGKDDVAEKTNLERSGKYKKKPAPVPPVEESRRESTSTLEPDDGDLEFCTPNASPLPERKFTQSSNNPPAAKEKDEGVVEQETKSKDFLEVPGKNKTKTDKKDDSHGKHKGSSRKMHIPKISFPFWNQKSSSKHSSGSESSSVASVEVAASNKAEESGSKNELEFIIPLKDEESKDRIDGSETEEGFGLRYSTKSKEKRKEESLN